MMTERSARRLLGSLGMDAPSARAASLASSAALSRPPGDDPHPAQLPGGDSPGNPPVIPPGIPPATDGGGYRSPLARIAAAQVPFGGPVGRTNRGRLAPLGGVVQPRRVVRFARLVHRRGRAFWQAFGLRRLRRQIDAARIAAQGGGVA
jgi:hypothetical protein